MIETTQHDDVTAYRLTWWRSRLIRYGVHVYVVRGVLVDTGFPAVASDVLAIAERRRVRGAIVTHQHEDHAGNVEALARAGVPLGIDDRTVAVVAHRHAIGLYRHFTWRAMPVLRSPFQRFADPSLRMVHTPGHSVDHHVVWDEHTDTLFAGDLFLGVKVRVAHPYEDPRRLVESLRATVARRPARVFCAHRGLVPQGAGALAAKADWLEDLIARVDALARAGASASEIRARLLGARGWIHWMSAGDYSPDNVIRAILRGTGEERKGEGHPAPTVDGVAGSLP